MSKKTQPEQENSLACASGLYYFQFLSAVLAIAGELKQLRQNHMLTNYLLEREECWVSRLNLGSEISQRIDVSNEVAEMRLRSRKEEMKSRNQTSID